MDVDELLRSTGLPGVSVDTDDALASTVRRGHVRRQRRHAVVGAGAVLAVAGLAAAGLGLAGRDDDSTHVVTGPPGREPAAEPHECEAGDGAVTDVASEPDWRQYADYRPWTDREGCLVRIDVLAERPGPGHCGWERATVLITGQPLGARYSSSSDDTEYVRDPDGVFDDPSLRAGFDPDASLPGTAVDSGYRDGDIELWHDPADPSAIWMVAPDRTERWPAAESPLCM